MNAIEKDDSARLLAEAIKANGNAYADGKIEYNEFHMEAMRLWDEVRACGLNDAVRALTVPLIGSTLPTEAEDPAPEFQCDCSRCDRPLFDTTDRKFYHCCDECDSRFGQEEIARHRNCERVEGSFL